MNFTTEDCRLLSRSASRRIRDWSSSWCRRLKLPTADWGLDYSSPAVWLLAVPT